MAKSKASPAAPEPGNDFVKTAADFEGTLKGADLARFRGYITDERIAGRRVPDRVESEWKVLVAELKTAGR